jgi:hypothetical protein
MVPASVVLDLCAFDDGTGPALYAGGLLTSAGPVPAVSVARWNGSTWTPLGSGVTGSVLCLTVFDDGGGRPALFAGGGFPPFPVSGGSNGIARWDGSSWFIGSNWVVGNIRELATHDDGTGPSLFVGGNFTMIGGIATTGIARWNCGSYISVSASQTSPVAPVFVSNANLTPGNEYFNIFSLDVCPGMPGSGLYSGLCIYSLANSQFVFSQLMTPLGTPLSHFVAPSSYLNWGPFALPPLTIDGICLDVTGGVLGPVSPVARLVIH